MENDQKNNNIYLNYYFIFKSTNNYKLQLACRIIISIENCFVFKAWQVVFKIPFGKRPTGYSSIMDFWTASGSYHDTSATARNDFSRSSEIFKSSILDDWVLQSISAVSNLHIYKCFL